MTIEFTSDGVDPITFFAGESGGHRWQRVPPTEHRGRVHTSTVTVAVFDTHVDASCVINEKDLDEQFIRSGGHGGQNVNKVSSCVRLLHRPSGISVRVDTERSQHENRRIARQLLLMKLNELSAQRTSDAMNDLRRDQIGLGQRGDKVRTYREQDDIVKDHVTGCQVRLSQLKKGNWSGIKR